MNLNVSRCIELPESLDKALADYLDSRTDWDQDRAIQAALSFFLMQNGNSNSAARTDLNTMFSAEAVVA
jgi:hypothetical protein